MYNGADPLFRPGDLGAKLRQISEGVDRAVSAIPAAQFLNASDEALVDSLLDRIRIKPLQIHRDQATLEQTETLVHIPDPFNRRRMLQVPGFSIRVDTPFTGSPGLWRLQPSSYQGAWPHAEVHSYGGDAGVLRVNLAVPADTPPPQIKQYLDRENALLDFYLSAQRSQIESANATLPSRIRTEVATRRARLLAQANLQATLGIPLKRDPYAPAVQPLPIKRRLVRPLPDAPSQGYTPEPGISDADHDHILGVIRHEGRTFESAPATFCKFDEEGLRDILLAHLNGHYEGDATGETFRKSGKTDIRIEAQDRSAFVGECKIWGGDKKFSDAIDQLLGYLTWRDCKTALIVFNRNVKDLNGLLEKIPTLLSSHPNIRGQVQTKAQGEWRSSFVSSSDSSREIILQVFLFDLLLKGAD